MAKVSQKEFLLKLEEICGIKKPVFLNTEDTWEIPDSALVFAKNLTVEHAIGRKRLTRENSDVCEIWIDVDNHDGIPFKDYKTNRLIPAIKKLNELGIETQYIHAKLSGRGFHLHVFVRGLPFEIDMKSFFNKTAGEEADQRSKVVNQKLREFGANASTKEGFTGLVEDVFSLKKLPVLKEPAYPDVRIFDVTQDFLINLSLTKTDQTQETIENDGLTDYERDGDFTQIYKCPLVKSLAKRAEIDKHLGHLHRLFLMSQFIHFGEESRKHLHTILKNCSDYDENYTNLMIQHAMKRGYHPFTCRYAREMNLGCLLDCQGSGGKSPIKFAWSALNLQEILDEFHKILIMPREDDEVIECCIAMILDPAISGEPTWAFLIAPSASGKTVILKSLHNDRWSLKLDSFTPKSLVSGKTVMDKRTKEEVLVEGILPKLHKKTLIIKEFTTTLMRGEEVRFEIFSQLRAMYDRDYSAAFGSIDYAKIPESWKHVRFGFLAGCTPYIDRYGSLNIILGERFIKLRLTEPDRIDATTKAAVSTFAKDKMVEHLTKKVTRFIFNLEIRPELLVEPQEYIERLAYLVETIVQLRKPISTRAGQFGTKIYEYEEATELGTRLVQQLIRLGAELCIVRGLDKWDDSIYKTLCRVAFNTLPPEREQLVHALFTQKDPISQTALKDKLGWSHDKTSHHLKELEYIGIVKTTLNTDYYLNENIRKLILHSRLLLHKWKVVDYSKATLNYKLNTHVTVTAYGKNDDSRRYNCPCYPCEQDACDGERGCSAYRHWLRWGWWL